MYHVTGEIRQQDDLGIKSIREIRLRVAYVPHPLEDR